MSKDEMIYQMEKMGYTMTIEPAEENSLSVTFNGRVSKYPYKNARRYSTEYTHHEIKQDCVSDLMSWAGCHIVQKIEYK